MKSSISQLVFCWAFLLATSIANGIVDDFYNDNFYAADDFYGFGDPTEAPTFSPTFSPSFSPTEEPTDVPTALPSFEPTAVPSFEPSANPTFEPSAVPSMEPTAPSFEPTAVPSMEPTAVPSFAPSAIPSFRPTAAPSFALTDSPATDDFYGFGDPTEAPTFSPTFSPSFSPTEEPTDVPTALPSFEPTALPSFEPSANPSFEPSAVPSMEPTAPSFEPTAVPSIEPTAVPSFEPSAVPSFEPSAVPSLEPTALPSFEPSAIPTLVPGTTESPTVTPTPSAAPSFEPSAVPSFAPSAVPSFAPTGSPVADDFYGGGDDFYGLNDPSDAPTFAPTFSPSFAPTEDPTDVPTEAPFFEPTAVPSFEPTVLPSQDPTAIPSFEPTTVPSFGPTVLPSWEPSAVPSFEPSAIPSFGPTAVPSFEPTAVPSYEPSALPSWEPSAVPSFEPTAIPSFGPTAVPSFEPSALPSFEPTAVPSFEPTAIPSFGPTAVPSFEPTAIPSFGPTAVPSFEPTAIPSYEPSALPSWEPSAVPSFEPTAIPSFGPTAVPSFEPTAIPSYEPSALPSWEPTTVPSFEPTAIPSFGPTAVPSFEPTAVPSYEPSALPSFEPTAIPSFDPTALPSFEPTTVPSFEPSTAPSFEPTAIPSFEPTTVPSFGPTALPSFEPTAVPSFEPTAVPSFEPSTIPSFQPSAVPSAVPSFQPTVVPSLEPTAAPSFQPTAAPSFHPTFEPSAVPSAVPSPAPSAVPTRVPSAAPSAAPTTSKPTLKPVNSPTRSPTRVPTTPSPSVSPTLRTERPTTSPAPTPTAPFTQQPSLRPTALPSTHLPTAQPTVSGEALWRETLQESLDVMFDNAANMSLASPVSHTSTYMDLDVLSLSGTFSSLYGGCTAWSKFIFADVAVSRYTQRPVAIQAVSVRANSADGNPYSSSSTAGGVDRDMLVQCTNEDRVTNIISALSNAASLAIAGSATTSTFSSVCDQRTWKVASCPVDVTTSTSTQSHYAALCVDCTDPCALQANECTYDTNGEVIAPPSNADYLFTAVAPCAGASNSAACNANTAPAQSLGSQLSVLQVIWSDIITPPEILSTTVVGTTSSDITVEVSLSKPGSVYCGVVSLNVELFTFSTPTSIDSILVQGFVADSVTDLNTGGRNMSSVTISDLPAAMPYEVYCVAGTRDVWGELSAMLFTVQTASTQCCKSLDVQLVHPTVPEDVTTPGFLILSSNARPLYDIDIKVHIFPSSVGVNTTGRVEELLLGNQLDLYSLTSSSLSSSTSPAVDTVLFPSSAFVSSTGGSGRGGQNFNKFSVSSSLGPALPAGTYYYTVEVTGDSAPEYAVNHLIGTAAQNFLSPTTAAADSLPSFTVLSSEVPPPSPELASAVFAPDGSFITISFSASTDMGQYANVPYNSGSEKADDGSGAARSSSDPLPAYASNVFTCSALFDFECAADFECTWSGAGTITAYVKSATVGASNSCIAPDSAVTLLENAFIRALCTPPSAAASTTTTTTTTCVEQAADWVPSNTSIVISALASSNPTAPVIAISAPARIGACDELVLDVSASRGSGGRDWQSLVFTFKRFDNSLGTSNGNSTARTEEEIFNASTALAAFLNTEYEVFPPSPIAQRLLIKDSVYTFTVTMCNFLQVCGTGSVSVLVIDDLLPTVFVPGVASSASFVKTMKRSDILSLAAQTYYVTSCDGDTSAAAAVVTSGLSHSWVAMRNNGVEDLSIVSVSKTPYVMRLPAFTLSVDSFYQFVITTTVEATQRSSSVSVNVYVASGNIYSRINGGGSNFAAVTAGDTLALDGSASEDEDEHTAESSSLLQFEWTCKQVSPYLNSSCSSGFLPPTMSLDDDGFDVSGLLLYSTSDTLVLQTQSSLPYSSSAAAADTVEVYQYDISLTVFDATRRRSDTSVLTVDILPALVPVPSLRRDMSTTTGMASAAANAKFNPSKVLKLIGSVHLPIPLYTAANASIEWTVGSSSGVDLSSTALTPLITSQTIAIPSSSSSSSLSSASLSSGMQTTTQNVFLALPNHVLTPGSTVSFTLSASLLHTTVGTATAGELYTSSATLRVVVNKAPTPGQFLVSPASGTELTQPFSFITKGWVDEDLPLTFEFSYYSSLSDNQIILRSRSQSTHSSSVSLPAGSSFANYTVRCAASIFDVFDGESIVESTVRVLPDSTTTALNATQILNFISDALYNSAENVDTLKQAVAMGSYLLNTVDCTGSSATDCAALNRSFCSSTLNTCGACLQGYIGGESGHANSACMLPEDFTTFLSSTPPASLPLKECVNGCSGHGTCVFVLNSAAATATTSNASLLSACSFGDSACSAVCECDIDYFGSAACDITTEDVATRQVAGELLLEAITTLMGLEDDSVEAAGSWIAALSETTSSSSNAMSPDAAATALSAVNRILAYSSSSSSSEGASSTSNVDEATLKGILATLNAIVSSSSSSSSRRLSLTEQQVTQYNAALKELIDSLQQYGSAVASTMVEQQQAYSYIFDEFRIVVQIIPSTATTSSGGTAVSALIPQTELEMSQRATGGSSSSAGNTGGTSVTLYIDGSSSSSSSAPAEFTAISIRSTALKSAAEVVDAVDDDNDGSSTTLTASDSSRILSDILSVYVSSLLCTAYSNETGEEQSAPCDVYITIDNFGSATTTAAGVNNLTTTTTSRSGTSYDALDGDGRERRLAASTTSGVEGEEELSVVTPEGVLYYTSAEAAQYVTYTQAHYINTTCYPHIDNNFTYQCPDGFSKIDIDCANSDANALGERVVMQSRCPVDVYLPSCAAISPSSGGSGDVTCVLRESSSSSTSCICTTDSGAASTSTSSWSASFVTTLSSQVISFETDSIPLEPQYDADSSSSKGVGDLVDSRGYALLVCTAVVLCVFLVLLTIAHREDVADWDEQTVTYTNILRTISNGGSSSSKESDMKDKSDAISEAVVTSPSSQFTATAAAATATSNRSILHEFMTMESARDVVDNTFNNNNNTRANTTSSSRELTAMTAPAAPAVSPSTGGEGRSLGRRTVSPTKSHGSMAPIDWHIIAEEEEADENGDDKNKPNTPESGKNKAFYRENSQSTAQVALSWLSWLDVSLPPIFSSSLSLGEKCAFEFKRYHIWFAALTAQPTKYTKRTRVVNLLLRSLSVLFALCMVYYYIYSRDQEAEDDSDGTRVNSVAANEHISCWSHSGSRSNCHSPLSSYGTGREKCEWDVDGSTYGYNLYDITTGEKDYECTLKSPENDIFVIVYMAMFAAFLACPVYFALSSVINALSLHQQAKALELILVQEQDTARKSTRKSKLIAVPRNTRRHLDDNEEEEEEGDEEGGGGGAIADMSAAAAAASSEGSMLDSDRRDDEYEEDQCDVHQSHSHTTTIAAAAAAAMRLSSSALFEAMVKDMDRFRHYLTTNSKDKFDAQWGVSRDRFLGTNPSQMGLDAALVTSVDAANNGGGGNASGGGGGGWSEKQVPCCLCGVTSVWEHSSDGQRLEAPTRAESNADKRGAFSRCMACFCLPASSHLITSRRHMYVDNSGSMGEEEKEREREEEDEEDEYLRDEYSPVEDVMRRELRRVQKEALAENSMLPVTTTTATAATTSTTSTSASSTLVTKRLLYLLQLELLSPLAAAAVQNKADRDRQELFGCYRRSSRHGSGSSSSNNSDRLLFSDVTLDASPLVINALQISVISIFAALLAAVLWLAFTAPFELQAAIVKSFLLWVLCDTVFISSAHVLWTHIILPLSGTALGACNLRNVKMNILQGASLQATLRMVANNNSSNKINHNGGSSDSDGHVNGAVGSVGIVNDSLPFNAARHFLVAHNLAQHHMSTVGAQAVHAYATFWLTPRLEYEVHRALLNADEVCTNGLVLALQRVFISFLRSGAAVRDTLSTSVLIVLCWGLLLAHVGLWYGHPALVMIPLVMCAVVVAMLRLIYSPVRKKRERDDLLHTASSSVHKNAVLQINSSTTATGEISGETKLAAAAASTSVATDSQAVAHRRARELHIITRIASTPDFSAVGAAAAATSAASPMSINGGAKSAENSPFVTNNRSARRNVPSIVLTAAEDNDDSINSPKSGENSPFVTRRQPVFPHQKSSPIVYDDDNDDDDDEMDMASIYNQSVKAESILGVPSVDSVPLSVASDGEVLPGMNPAHMGIGSASYGRDSPAFGHGDGVATMAPQGDRDKQQQQQRMMHQMYNPMGAGTAGSAGTAPPRSMMPLSLTRSTSSGGGGSAVGPGGPGSGKHRAAPGASTLLVVGSRGAPRGVPPAGFKLGSPNSSPSNKNKNNNNSSGNGSSGRFSSPNSPLQSSKHAVVAGAQAQAETAFNTSPDTTAVGEGGVVHNAGSEPIRTLYTTPDGHPVRIASRRQIMMGNGGGGIGSSSSSNKNNNISTTSPTDAAAATTTAHSSSKKPLVLLPTSASSDEDAEDVASVLATFATSPPSSYLLNTQAQQQVPVPVQSFPSATVSSPSRKAPPPPPAESMDTVTYPPSDISPSSRRQVMLTREQSKSPVRAARPAPITITPAAAPAAAGGPVAARPGSSKYSNYGVNNSSANAGSTPPSVFSFQKPAAAAAAAPGASSSYKSPASSPRNGTAAPIISSSTGRVVSLRRIASGSSNSHNNSNNNINNVRNAPVAPASTGAPVATNSGFTSTSTPRPSSARVLQRVSSSQKNTMSSPAASSSPRNANMAYTGGPPPAPADYDQSAAVRPSPSAHFFSSLASSSPRSSPRTASFKRGNGDSTPARDGALSSPRNTAATAAIAAGGGGGAPVVGSGPGGPGSSKYSNYHHQQYQHQQYTPPPASAAFSSPLSSPRRAPPGVPLDALRGDLFDTNSNNNNNYDNNNYMSGDGGDRASGGRSSGGGNGGGGASRGNTSPRQQQQQQQFTSPASPSRRAPPGVPLDELRGDLFRENNNNNNNNYYK